MSLEQYLISRWQFNEQDGSTTLDDISGIKDKVHYIFNEAMFQPNRQLRRRDGINEKAMWFDGYSTYIQRKRDKFTIPTSSFTISLWVAPHVFGVFEDERLTALILRQDSRHRFCNFFLPRYRLVALIKSFK